MPRLKRNLVLALGGLDAFLSLDASVERGAPENSPERTEKRLGRELQQGKERRGRAESKLKQLHDGVASAEQKGGLPEPDKSIDRRQVFRSLISQFKPGRMLDLGAGPGKFALDAAHLGWKVTAVDARTVRTPDPEAERDPERAELIRSVRWVEADVREFPIRSGEYDLICILGLLHHLEVDDQIKLLKRCSETLTLMSIRIAPEIVDTVGPYEGWHRREQGETREERDEIFMASWGNEVSFWHSEESLVRLIRDCGYGGAMPIRPPFRRNYGFYLCLPLLFE
jgi:SAM-dependent methyltransferase